MTEIVAFRIQDRKYLTEKDEMGRTRIGYEPGMTEEEIYNAGRGIWKISPTRLFKAKCILITNRQGVVLQEFELTGVQRVENGKYVLTGDINHDSEYVGHTININQSRNSINYISTRYLKYLD